MTENNLEGRVKWFDHKKGYGFVEIITPNAEFLKKDIARGKLFSTRTFSVMTFTIFLFFRFLLSFIFEARVPKLERFCAILSFKLTIS